MSSDLSSCTSRISQHKRVSIVRCWTVCEPFRSLKVLTVSQEQRHPERVLRIQREERSGAYCSITFSTNKLPAVIRFCVFQSDRSRTTDCSCSTNRETTEHSARLASKLEAWATHRKRLYHRSRGVDTTTKSQRRILLR